MHALSVLIALTFGNPAIQFDKCIFSPGIVCPEMGVGVALFFNSGQPSGFLMRSCG
jgi:hypothetical protein